MTSLFGRSAAGRIDHDRTQAAEAKEYSQLKVKGAHMSAMRIVSDDVRQFIVSLYQSGAHTQRMIAEIVGTTQSNISKIISKARRDGMLLPKRNVA
ncbi:MAG TPA: hypothetical protein VL992_21035, partial [Tepidisphaeraceae bacterium]|nr:hypothetical protein [Tepidisphaeraceae bacterium]